jgi:predicted RNA-binding Zn ribbon-like protein
MAYAWAEKQFVAGTVALDFANTVCYRQDPARRLDKIPDAVELAAFARAARIFSDAGSFQTENLAKRDGPFALTLYREVREATDVLFRPVGYGGQPEAAAFSGLLRLYQTVLADHPLEAGADGIEIGPRPRPSFALVLLHSALRLATSSEMTRTKICPNCHWLFVDRSRNSSRVWCDMLTCGNRAKVQRHHARHRSPVAKRTRKRRIGG